jgi:hypothetical protein
VHHLDFLKTPEPATVMSVQHLKISNFKFTNRNLELKALLPLREIGETCGWCAFTRPHHIDKID